MEYRDLLANDKALALFSLGMPKKCLETLDETFASNAYDDEDEFSYDKFKELLAEKRGMGIFPPSDWDVYAPIARSIWENRRKCKGTAERYKYKEINEFKSLESFNSIEEFESYFQEYIQDCLNNTSGGTAGIPCLIKSQIWDRELNTYYKKLMNILQEKEKKLLQESQRAWIQERDQSATFNSRLLDIKYEGKMGTMYALMRAGDADGLIAPIVKQRTLLLRTWFEFVESQGRDVIN